MGYELHIVEDTYDAFRRRIAKANAEVNLDATPANEADAGPSTAAAAAETSKATRTRRARADAPQEAAQATQEAAQAAPAAEPAQQAAPAAEPAQQAAQAPQVTIEALRAEMGKVVALHPDKGAAVTGFLAKHANGAKNLSGADPSTYPALMAAAQEWLAANPADPTA